MAHQLTDERLAWLVARDEVRNKAAGGLLRRFLLGAARGGGYMPNVTSHDGNEVQAELVSDKMMRYSIVVDEAAQRLTQEERVQLRTQHTLPGWFMPHVHEAVKSVPRQRRG